MLSGSTGDRWGTEMRGARAAIALAAWALAAGCASSPPRAEGEILYCGGGARGAAVVVLTTEPSAARSGRTRPDLGPKAAAPGERVVTHVAPEEMAALLAALEDAGLFELPGAEAAPAVPPPRSIAVRAGDRRLFVALARLIDPEHVAAFGRAARLIVAASQKAGPRYGLFGREAGGESERKRGRAAGE